VDPTQMFYLESRGLDEETSRSLIVEGFLQSLLERLCSGSAC
ncbi:MAG: SufD family Fe-S cluster assembly protein, partial [Solirubrobacterales bacterium]